MDDYNEVIKSLLTIKNVTPIEVTKEQNNALEALVVAYMSVASMNLEKSTEQALLAQFDAVWDGLVKKPPQEG